MVEQLVRAGARVDGVGTAGYAPLHLAAKAGDVRLLKLFVNTR